MPELERSQIVYAPLGEVFRFFSDPRQLRDLTPAWMRFTVDKMPEDAIYDACEIDYTIRWMRLPVRWTTVITDYEQDKRFVDQQKRGPYKRWWHEHRFQALTPEITVMTDVVRYEMPFSLLGGLAHALVVRRQLFEILEYRARVIERLFPAPSDGVGMNLGPRNVGGDTIAPNTYAEEAM